MKQEVSFTVKSAVEIKNLTAESAERQQEVVQAAGSLDRK